MSNNNSNTFRSSNETLFLVNILNTMYNDNLRQINNLNETLNNLNNSNNQIRNLLIQILHGNQGNVNTRRNHSRRFDNNSNNIDYSNIINGNGRNVSYLIGEYTIPINRNRNNNNNNNNNNNRNRPSTLDNYARNIFEHFLQPVEIYPTQSQIESATRRVRYCDIARPINTSCPISMDEFNDNDMVTVIRHCGHTFHNEHIMNWFRSNCRCPVCRYDIRDYSSNVSNQFFNSSRDSSNNNVERNNNNNNNSFSSSLFNENITNVASTSLENFLLNSINTGIFDPSGNYTNNQIDLLTSLFNALNRNRNTL